MQNTHALDYRLTPTAAWPLPGGGIAQIANRLLADFFQLDKLSSVYDDIRMEGAASQFIADRALIHLNVSHKIVHGSLENIPREGPLLVVSNHPFGGIEGLVLLSLLNSIRPDVKMMATEMLSGIPELQKHLFFVDPFNGSGAASKNTMPVRQSLRWLKNGNTLGMFPSGEVAHLDLAQRRICESDWHETVARLVRHSGASVLPVFFEGANGPLFQIAGLIHPRLRTAMLGREMINKTGHTLKVYIGHSLPFSKLNAFSDNSELTRYLKMRVQLLGAPPEVSRKRLGRTIWAGRKKPIVAASSPNSLAEEIAWLLPEQKLLEVGDYRVYIATAKQIPGVIREIARLREVTFRAVGEGTGQAMDIDVFDRIYQHLFVWNDKTSEVVGAYRLGLIDKIIPQFGLRGLYTSTLFKYGWDFIDFIEPAIEIGRSFIRQEYQRKHLPLLLLWKGIGTFVAMNPNYRKLFGTVSMSNCYHEASRQLAARYFAQATRLQQNLPALSSRNPLKIKPIPGSNETGPVCRIPDMDALDEMVSEIEADGKGIPVLIRQYMKMGGQVLACNVDPKFNMALDALMLVDLTQTDPRLLDIYMGKRTAGYLLHHGIVIREERQSRCA